MTILLMQQLLLPPLPLLPQRPPRTHKAPPKMLQWMYPASYLPSGEPEIPEPGIPDGVYTGTGQGRNGEITVCVTIDSGEIVDIQIVSHAETPKYFSRAEEIISTILSEQSTEVDAVTGATLSSNGIKSAVANALER